MSAFDLRQPMSSVPVTVYCVLAVGLAITEEPVSELSAELGDQVKAIAPLAVSIVENPEQIIALVETLIVGNELISTVISVVPLQPLMSEPVTVYCVLSGGLAITLDPVAEDNLKAGFHE